MFTPNLSSFFSAKFVGTYLFVLWSAYGCFFGFGVPSFNKTTSICFQEITWVSNLSDVSPIKNGDISASYVFFFFFSEGFNSG